VDEAKVAQLKAGKPTIFEPHLEELMQLCRDRLTFTTSYEEAVPKAEIIFIAVGTPTGVNGAPDLKYVQAAARGVGENLGDGCAVVVNKSTVPIGSANWVESLVRDAFAARGGTNNDRRFAVASNPEFLREGAALFDTLYADRTVIGADDIRAVHALTDL